ncbi:MAG: amidohydrolase [Lentisphaeria bacterium]|nr:amidohydrolase [Lentisphaeria bacterium]
MIIVNGIVHDAVSEKPRRVSIRIEKGKISGMGSRLVPKRGEEVVDAQGMNVYPGLVEAHSHIGLASYAVRAPIANDYNENTDIVTPELDPVDAIDPADESFKNAVAGGVTCVGTGPGSSNVLGGTFTAIKTVGRRIDDMIVKHKVAMKCAFGENPKSVYGSKNNASRMTTAFRLREQLAKAKEYMEKREAAAKSKDPNAKKPDLNLRLEALIPVLKGEIPLKAHAHQANDIFTAIRIAREFGVKLTLEHCTEGHLIADILAKEGFMLAVGPSFGFPKKPELKNKTFATPGILAKAGCHVSIITDCGVTPQEYLGMVAGLAVQAGMDRFAAFKAITINAAEHLGIADRVGSLEVGKDGDVVICDGDIMSNMCRVKQVFIEGKSVYQSK